MLVHCTHEVVFLFVRHAGWALQFSAGSEISFWSLTFWELLVPVARNHPQASESQTCNAGANAFQPSGHGTLKS